MIIPTLGKSAGHLVDAERGEISREIFSNAEIYAAELEQIFARSWLFVGHESQIPNPGDYFVSRMGEESVIVVRDQESKLHVFLNSCRHRGMKVCRYDEGNTRLFTCPFHAWSFATDGRLIGVPYYKEYYREGLDKSKWGLIEVAKLESYKGAIWACWDPDAPDFFDYLGGMRECLDYLLDGWDGSEGGSEVAVGVQKWVVPCNWKFGSDNFVGDAYHNISHRSVDMIGIGPSGDTGRRDSEYQNISLLSFSFPGKGHGGVNVMFPEGGMPGRNYPGEVGAWFRKADDSRQERYGEMARVMGVVGTTFPNMSYRAGQPRQILVWHPAGPDKTEVWSWYLADKNAPENIKAFYRDYALRYCGPGGMTESDDLENWTYAHQACQGTIGKRYAYNYSLGLAGETSSDEIVDLGYPAVVGITEKNARDYYARWGEFMDAGSWADIKS